LAVGGFDGLLQSLVEAGVVGYHLVDAGDRENALDSGARHRQQHRTTRGQGVLVRIHHDTKPGGITKPGPGHVDHERRRPARGCFHQSHPEPVSVGGVDLLRHRHDRHAPEHVNRKPDLKHRRHLLRAEHRPVAYYQDPHPAGTCQ
jgi:hypothetical protein